MNAKQAAAEQAVEQVEDGMIVGLGTGTTSVYAIRRLGERVAAGLRIQAVASSAHSEALARELGIAIIPFASVEEIAITIDGADEVDDGHNLIKGGGGALLREKILAANSKRLVIIVDESKLVRTLGKFPLPVEITPFAYELTLRRLAALNCEPQLRANPQGETFVTDNGNYIADCSFAAIADPERLSPRIHAIPGVVEHGLFVKMAAAVIVGSDDGTTRQL